MAAGARIGCGMAAAQSRPMQGVPSDRKLGVRWARWTARRRAPILWSALLVAIVATPIAARLPLRGDMSYLLPPGAQSVRDLHALEARAQVFGTIIVAIESDDAERRAAATTLVRERLAALPAGTLLGVAADSAARDRFAWDHRHLLVPTGDLTAVRDELAQRKARMNPLFVALDDDDAATRAEHGPSLPARLRELKRQLDAAAAGAAHPTPLVSKDGRLQIIVARTPFASGEVSRNAPVLAAVERMVDEARAAAGPSVSFGITGDVVTNAAEHRALLDGMLRATVFTVAIVAVGMLLFFRSAAPVAALLGALTLGALVTFAFTRLASATSISRRPSWRRSSSATASTSASSCWPVTSRSAARPPTRARRWARPCRAAWAEPWPPR